LLLGLASTVVLGSKSHGTYDHILLSDVSGSNLTAPPEYVGESQPHFTRSGPAQKVVSYFFSEPTVLISGLFNDTVNSLVYITSNDKKMKGNNKLEGSYNDLT
jgi:hypothetical protein